MTCCCSLSCRCQESLKECNFAWVSFPLVDQCTPMSVAIATEKLEGPRIRFTTGSPVTIIQSTSGPPQEHHFFKRVLKVSHPITHQSCWSDIPTDIRATWFIKTFPFSTIPQIYLRFLHSIVQSNPHLLTKTVSQTVRPILGYIQYHTKVWARQWYFHIVLIIFLIHCNENWFFFSGLKHCISEEIFSP